jgi:hypothetical protein
MITAALVFSCTGAVLVPCIAASYWRGRQTEPLLRFLDPRLTPTIDEAFVSYPVEYALRSDESNDVVFIGDSTCHDGVDPARLPGLRCYNLGSLGSIGPVGIFLTTKAYLDHHPQPRAIVLCVSPLRFEVSQSSGGGHVIRRLIANYGPEVGGVIRLHESSQYFVRRGALDLFAAGAGGSAILDGPLRGMETETYETLRDKMRDTRGFFSLPKEHGGRWELEMPAPRVFILDEWKEGLSALSALCRRTGVPLVVRFAPIWDGVCRSRDFKKLDGWADEFEAPDAIVKRPVIVAWEQEVMWDALHLNARGVDRFMPMIARDVQQALAH